MVFVSHFMTSFTYFECLVLWSQTAVNVLVNNTRANATLTHVVVAILVCRYFAKRHKSILTYIHLNGYVPQRTQLSKVQSCIVYKCINYVCVFV